MTLKSDSQPVIRLEGVTKRYDGSIAVDDVTLSILKGKRTALIGPSGSGKSTLLSLIVGIETPSEGAVYVDGRQLTPQSAVQLRRGMGYVTQDGGLFPHMTARKNIELMAKECSWPHGRREQRIEELCTLTRFPREALDRYPIELSGGQRQRVSLMRALMLDPDILLMDEPMGALDPMIRTDLQDDLKTIFVSVSKTVVLVTHDLAEAAYLGDEIVLINHGLIVQKDAFDELVRSPKDEFVKKFLDAQLRRAGALSDGYRRAEDRLS
jgi:osmoprotectant transport system ATP-binding protein